MFLQTLLVAHHWSKTSVILPIHTSTVCWESWKKLPRHRKYDASYNTHILHSSNFENSVLKRIAAVNNPIGQSSYSFQTKNLKIGRVLFFGDTSCPRKKLLKSVPTLRAYNYGLKQLYPHKLHIFGKPWPCPFTWCHPGWVIVFEKIEKRAF